MEAHRPNPVYRAAWYLARFLLHLLFGYRVEGAENIPREGPVILAANHLSILDPIAVGAGVRRPVSFLARADVFLTNFRRPALARLTAAGGLTIAGVCDRSAKAAGDFAAATVAQAAFTDAAEMLDRCRPDGLVVLTPPQVTPAIIELAAERKIPFFTEKPPATDAETHRRLIELVGELPHVIGYNRRVDWDELVARLKRVTATDARPVVR